LLKERESSAAIQEEGCEKGRKRRAKWFTRKFEDGDGLHAKGRQLRKGEGEKEVRGTKRGRLPSSSWDPLG